MGFAPAAPIPLLRVHLLLELDLRVTKGLLRCWKSLMSFSLRWSNWQVGFFLPAVQIVVSPVGTLAGAGAQAVSTTLWFPQATEELIDLRSEIQRMLPPLIHLQRGWTLDLACSVKQEEVCVAALADPFHELPVI